MKKLLSIAAVLFVAMLVWTALVQQHDLHLMFNGEELDTPFDFLVGVFAAGAGIAITVVVLLFVFCLLALVFAGVFAGLGAAAVAALGVAGIAVALVISPLVLLALIPVWGVRKLMKSNRQVPTDHAQHGALAAGSYDARAVV